MASKKIERWPQPCLKWAGGKRQLLTEIRKYLPRPQDFTTYYEPFLGGGAVLFDVQPATAVVNDINAEVINVYRVIKEQVNELIAHLKTHKNEPAYYYQIRELDRTPDFQTCSLVAKASRVLYLNKTCYNGLFRVNRQGQFNVPFGRYKNPKIVDEANLQAISAYLNEHDVTILHTDFAAALTQIPPRSFVYLDPPYDPVSDSASFTGYTLNGFNRTEQVRLREVCRALDRQGCKFLLSNSATPFIVDLYREYQTIFVTASRCINSKISGRGKIDEVLVRNYA